jgi:hypothetical protein
MAVGGSQASRSHVACHACEEGPAREVRLPPQWGCRRPAVGWQDKQRPCKHRSHSQGVATRRRPPRALQSLRSPALLSSASLSQRSRCFTGSPAQSSQMAQVGMRRQAVPSHSLTDKRGRSRHERVHRSARDASASLCCARIQACNLWNTPANAAKPASPFDQ